MPEPTVSKLPELVILGVPLPNTQTGNIWPRVHELLCTLSIIVNLTLGIWKTSYISPLDKTYPLENHHFLYS